MDTTGTRLGILCVALTILLSACAGPETAAPDPRTPPDRETPSRTAGELGSDGAAGLGP
ncbi:MAG TPA: hypothetical protein VNS46_09810 [Nocardioides sp.]|nr:hypothetical protein [Nocardioides sp.]